LGCSAPRLPRDAFGSAAEINKYFVDHRFAALIQSALIHGLAGVALVVLAARPVGASSATMTPLLFRGG